LRQEVLLGQARPEGLGAVAYHGLVQGLVVLLHRPLPATSAASSPPPSNPPSPPNPELVALLASMVLRTHPEVRHVF
jgi:hypothetical protein